MTDQKILESISEINLAFNKLEPHVRKLAEHRFDIDTGDLIDHISLIQEIYVSETDGRPKPFDLSEYVPDPDAEKFKNLDKETKQSMRNSRRRLTYWAECASPGYNEIVTVGSYSFDTAELTKLRDWINTVLDFHHSNPEKRRKSMSDIESN